jgi:deoxyribonuclease V
MWPTDGEELLDRQRQLAELSPEPWLPRWDEVSVGGCWVCFPRGETGQGKQGDPAWTAAASLRGHRIVEQVTGSGLAGAAYLPGMLALRQGALLAGAVRRLERPPEVVLVDGTGRDHPRRAGLALHLGAELDLPTVGVTHRPLLAHGEWPADAAGATSPVRLGPDVVAAWLRTRPGTRPLVVHPGWRTDLDTAIEVVRRSAVRRTPEPLRVARRAAREARAASYG